MIYQCSNCSNEFEDKQDGLNSCPICKADKTYFIYQPFNVLSEMESHNDMGNDHIFED